MKKYASQANISRLWSKIKAIASTKADDNKVIKLDGTTPIQVCNSHGGRQFYYNLMNNLFYKANEKWNVTYTLTAADGTESAVSYSAVLFNYDYENGISIPAGGSLKITMTFDTDESKTYNGHKCFPGYPYGFYYLSFYYKKIPESVTARAYDVYLNSAGAWYDLTVSTDVRSAGNYEIVSVRNPNLYGLTTLEFTINAKSDTGCLPTQLEFYCTRPYTCVIQNKALEAKTADNAITATTATSANKLNVTSLSNSGRTIAGLQTALNNWLNSNFSAPAACAFYGDIDWATAWNSGDTSKTYSAGYRWTVQIIGTFTSPTYTQLWVSTYYNGYAFIVAKENGVWQPVRRIMSNVGTYNNAQFAEKLRTENILTAAGSATRPVYFDEGVPKACTYTLGKSVPSDAVFTDTVTTVDSIPIQNSTNAIQSGWVYTNNQKKADKATTLAGYGITDAYTKTETDLTMDNILGLVGNSKFTVSGYMPSTSSTVGKSSGITAGQGAVKFTLTNGSEYTGTFTVKTDGIDSSCEYSGIKPGKWTMVNFKTMPVFAYKASESSALSGFAITLLYPPAS